MGQHYGNFDNKVVGIVRVAERVHSRGYSTNTQTYTFSRAPEAGEVVVLSSWWDGNYLINTPSGFTTIVSNEDGSEYPEGETCYKIAGSSEGTTYTVTCASSDDCAGIGLILKANTAVSSVSIGNTAYSDGPTSLVSEIAADSPTTVASNTGRLKLYFLTGRQQPAYIQDPTPTFVNATGWIYENGNNVTGSTNDTTGGDNMDWAYKVLRHGATDATERITTNDTGRQGHHLISLTFS